MEILNQLNQWHLLFIFGIIFIFVFRKPINGLLNRTTKVGKSGLEAASVENQNDSTSNTAEAVEELLSMVGSSIVIDDLEKSILNDLKTRGLDTTGDSVKVLTKHLAGTQLLAGFERVHSIIFGSQIGLLEALNESAGKGKSREFVEGYFNAVVADKNNASISEWKLSQYLEYLFTNILITQNNDEFHITNMGVEFLTWLVRSGKPRKRVL